MVAHDQLSIFRVILKVHEVADLSKRDLHDAVVVGDV